MNRYVHSLMFSPDERLLAAGTVAGVMVCNLEPGADVAPLIQPGPVARLLFSGEGRRLAACSRRGGPGVIAGIRVWDVTSGSPAGALLPTAGAPIIFPGPSGDEFFTIELNNGRLRRWSFSAAAPVEEIGNLADWPLVDRVEDLVWSFDPARLILARGSTFGNIRRWDLKTGRRIGPDGEFGHTIRSMAFGPDGRWIAVAGEDGEVGLFDPLTCKRTGPLLSTGVPIRGLTFSPDGRQLLTAATDGRITRWDLGKPLPLDPGTWQTWLEAATGMRLTGDALVPLTLAEYQDRLAAARLLPVPLALELPPPVDWHREEAENALADGQINSAHWHMDRWIAQEPADWQPLARRARVQAIEGYNAGAEADLEQAAKLCHDDGLANWRRHQAAIARINGRRFPILNPPE
jgi:WD40 repeat protein